MGLWRRRLRCKMNWDGFLTRRSINGSLPCGWEMLFELKTVERLAGVHRSQLLNYLLLTGLEHGKLINFRPQSVEHEFVNTSLTHADRTRFVVQDDQWNASLSGSCDLQQFVVGLLRDWGAGLDLHLYEEAVTDFLGGPENVCREIDVVNQGRALGMQTARLLDPQTTFKITAISENLDLFNTQIHRFLRHTTLQHVLWINVALSQLTFKTVSRPN